MENNAALPKTPKPQKDSADYHKKRKIAIMVTAIICGMIILIVTLCSVFLTGGQPVQEHTPAAAQTQSGSVEDSLGQESSKNGGTAQKPVYVDPDYDGLVDEGQLALEGAYTNGTNNAGNTTDDAGGNTESVVAAGKVTLSNIDKKLLVGKQFTLTATVLPGNTQNKTVTWKSSNESVAVVRGGVVTAKIPGIAVITATTDNGKTAACTVTVREKTAYDAPYDSQAIYNDMIAYGQGKGFTLNTSLTVDNAEYFTEYTGDGWYEEAPDSLWSKCVWMIDNAEQTVTGRTGGTDGHSFFVILKQEGGEYRIYVLYE